MGDGDAAATGGDLDQGSEQQNPQGHVASAVEDCGEVAVAGRPPRAAAEASEGARAPQEAISGALLLREGGDTLRFAGNPVLHGPLGVCLQGDLLFWFTAHIVEFGIVIVEILMSV